MGQLGAPDFTRIIGAYEAGADRARRSRLDDLAEQSRTLSGAAIGGDQTALTKLAGVDLPAYMQVKQLGDAEKKQWLTDFTRAAYAAKTPEQRAALIKGYEAKGHVFDAWEKDPNNWDALVARGVDLGDQMGLDLRREEAARSQKNADRGYNLDVQQFNESKRVHDAEIAAKQADGPDLVEIFDDTTGQPYKARWDGKQYVRVGGVKAPNGTQLEVGPNGEVSFTQGMGKPLTEGQSKDVGYLNRMNAAMPALDKHSEALLSFGESVAGHLPLGAGNYLKSSEYQQAEQAGRGFLTALLRKDSGAQIPPSEEKSYGDVFLPRPGDKKEVLAQKREARRQAAIGIKMGLPANAIKTMVLNGVDFSALDAPAEDAAGKTDQAPRVRTYNPATGELE